MNAHLSRPMFGRALIGLTAGLLAAASPALATCPVPNGCTRTDYVDITAIPTFTVASDAAQNAQGLWDYRYTFSSDVTPSTAAPFIVSSLNLPYFADANISQMRVGSATSGYQSLSLVDAAGGAKEIQLRTSFVPPANLPSVFSVIEFTSSYAPGAPGTARLLLSGMSSSTTSYESGYTVTTITRGVPPTTPTLLALTLPGSPMAIAASSVPEPSSVAFMMVGMAGLAVIAARKRQASASTAVHPAG